MTATRRWILRLLLIVTAASAVAGVGAASGHGGRGAAFVDALHSTLHLLGFVVSATLIWTTVRLRRKFAGGVIGEQSRYAILGAVLFSLAFLNMELANGFGIVALSFLPSMQWILAVNMALFIGSVVASTYAFYRISDVFAGLEGEA